MSNYLPFELECQGFLSNYVYKSLKNCNSLQNFWALTWIDPQYDIPFPDKIKTRKLDYLCFEHGFKNPFKHRALFDVLAMFEIMSQYDIDTIVKRSQSPKITISAVVSYDDRLMAKNAGFWWDGNIRYWIKEIKEMDFETLEKTLPFQIVNMTVDEDELPF